MARAWNPRQVLDVYPDSLDFHCSGTTLRGVRCRNHDFFSHDLLREAATILDTLPDPRTYRDNTPQLLASLKRLAFCTLCPKWHRGNNTKAGSQIDPVSQRWLATLQELAAQGSQPRSGSRRSAQSRNSSASTLPSISEATSTSATISAGPSRRRYLVDGAYPSPPPSPSTTPTTSYAASSNDSRSSSSYRGSEVVSSTGYSYPSGSSSRRSTSSRTHGPRLPSVQVNVNITVNLETIRQRRVAALDRPSTVSTPPSTPSPSQTSSRRTSISSTRSSVALPAALAGIETPGSQLASRSNRTSRASSRSTNHAPEDSYRSPAPEPSAISNFSAPLAVIREAFPPPVRSPLRIPRTSPLSASMSSAGAGPSGRNRINTPVSTGASTPVTPQGDDQSFEAALDTFLNSPSSPSSGTLSSSEAPSAMSAFPGLVRRRPISNTTCYICYEVIEHYADAAWCRRGCGQNVHWECFETWRDHLEGMRPSRAVTCGFCRAPWGN